MKRNKIYISLVLLLYIMIYPSLAFAQEEDYTYCLVTKDKSSSWPKLEYSSLNHGVKSQLEKKKTYISHITSFDNKRENIIKLFNSKGWDLIDDKSKSENEVELEFRINPYSSHIDIGKNEINTYCLVTRHKSTHWPDVKYDNLSYGVKTLLEKKKAYVHNLSSFDNKRKDIINIFTSKGWDLVDDESKSENEVALRFRISLDDATPSVGKNDIDIICKVIRPKTTHWPEAIYENLSYGNKTFLEENAAYIKHISSFDNTREKVIQLFTSKGWKIINDESKNENEINLTFSFEFRVKQK